MLFKNLYIIASLVERGLGAVFYLSSNLRHILHLYKIVSSFEVAIILRRTKEVI